MENFKEIDVKFTNSCIPIDLPCEVGTHFINPCNCSSYYQCHQRYQPPLLRQCGPGTAWDRTIQNCNDENTVHFKGICSQTQPWSQCSKIYDDLNRQAIDELRKRCVDVTTPHGGDRRQEGVDTGAIAGGVIGGIIVVVLLLLVLFYLRSRGGFLREIPKCLRFSRPDVKTSADNPQYGAEDDEERYTTIDQVMESSDVHSYKKTDSIKPPVPKRPLHTLPIPDIIKSSNSADETDYDNRKEERHIPTIASCLHHVPSGYSSPYQIEIETTGTSDRAQLPPTEPEMTQIRTQGQGRNSDERAPLPLPKINRPDPPRQIPEYVDFSDMDGDYSLATTPARFDIRNIENKW